MEAKEHQVPDIEANSVKYTLSAILYDDQFASVLANVDYALEGPNGEELSGTTDGNGRLHHEDVAPGYYKVSVGDDFAYIPSTNDDSVFEQRIPNMFLEEKDAEDEETPVADES